MTTKIPPPSRKNDILITIPAYVEGFDRACGARFLLTMRYEHLEALRVYLAMIENRKTVILGLEKCWTPASHFLKEQANALRIGSFFLGELVQNAEKGFEKCGLLQHQPGALSEAGSTHILRSWLEPAFAPALTSWQSKKRTQAVRTLEIFFPGLTGEYTRQRWQSSLLWSLQRAEYLRQHGVDDNEDIFHIPVAHTPDFYLALEPFRHPAEPWTIRTGSWKFVGTSWWRGGWTLMPLQSRLEWQFKWGSKVVPGLYDGFNISDVARDDGLPPYSRPVT